MPLNKGNSSIFVPTVKWKSPLKYAQPLWSCLSLKNKGPNVIIEDMLGTTLEIKFVFS